MTENDKKKDKQGKEIEICSYSLIAFLHKVQSTKVLSRKGIKDGNMDTIFCNQYAWTDSIWTDSMTKVSNKIIIKDIFTPFIVPLNIHITDILIKESLTDSPLLIIKENINCDNFLNNDRFNLPIDRINPMIDCPILFHIFSQDEIYSSICMDRIILDFRNILNLTYSDRPHHDYSNTVATQQEHKSVQRKFCFINAFLVFFFYKIFQKNFTERHCQKNFKRSFAKYLLQT